MIARVVELILFGLMPFLAGSIVANGRELVDDDPAAEVRSVDTQLLADSEITDRRGGTSTTQSK